jgi:hypothetical protein
MIVPGNAEYERSGQATDLEEDTERKVFSTSFPVYPGVEACDAD